MTSRYVLQDEVLNSERMYKEHFRKRGVPYIRHYSTPELRHPTVEEVADMATLTHVWKQGDRYFKLAHYHYGDPKLWWVIAWLNQAPTEAHLEFGDEILIPLELEVFLETIQL